MKRLDVERRSRETTGVQASIHEPLAVVEEAFECGDRAAWGHRVVFAAEAAETTLAADPGLDGEGIEAVEWFEALPERVQYEGLVEAGRDRLR